MSQSEDIRTIIREAMQENSAQLIQATISATTEVLDAKLLEHTKGMKEIIDEKIASSSKWQRTDFKNNINENNFKHVQSIERLWNKTAQAIENKRYPQAAEFCTEGKLQSNKRLKLLCIADREGWETALAYQGDALADDELDEKRLDRARKISQVARVKTSGRSAGTSTGKAPLRFGDRITCWDCGRLGHTVRDCPQKHP